ncbi:MAG TPA: nucleotidyltransferase domain-containing protein [Pseudolabrys sp.]
MTPRLGRCLEDIRRICYFEGMRRGDVIARLKEAEPGLRARGIRRAAVFGSVARGKERSDSDIDILSKSTRTYLSPSLSMPALKNLSPAFSMARSM